MKKKKEIQGAEEILEERIKQIQRNREWRRSLLEMVIFLAAVYVIFQYVLGIVTEKKTEILDQEIEDMIQARKQARKEKNFALADEIRGKLLDMGIVLEDTREGVKWKRVR